MSKKMKTSNQARSIHSICSLARPLSQTPFFFQSFGVALGSQHRGAEVSSHICPPPFYYKHPVLSFLN